MIINQCQAWLIILVWMFQVWILSIINTNLLLIVRVFYNNLIIITDSPHKIFIGGLPNYLNEDQVCTRQVLILNLSHIFIKILIPWHVFHSIEIINFHEWKHANSERNNLYYFFQSAVEEYDWFPLNLTEKASQ